MSCEKYCELISAYIDNEVTEEEKAAVERHISQCQSCRAALDSMRAIKKAVGGGAPEVKPSPKLMDLIYKRLLHHLLLVFLLFVAGFSFIAVSGGMIQLYFMEGNPAMLNMLFNAGVTIILVGLAIILYDVFVDLVKILGRRD